MMNKSDIDKRICDCEPGATNTETYREFIINAIKEIYGEKARLPDIDKMSELEINELIDDLDYLLEK